MNSLFVQHKKYIFLFVICIVLLSSFLSFDYENFFPFFSRERIILASIVFSPPSSNGEKFQILKLKSNNNIFLEAYEITSDGNYKFLSRIDTRSKYDGFFLLGGNATNLAYVDIDDDSSPEIIAPSFDKNLVAYLNVVHFDSMNKTFTLLTNIPSANN